MAISLERAQDDEVISVINTTPLVDVMLVLLIIFLITIPVVTATVKVDLPKAANQVSETRPQDIWITVDARGQIYWQDQRINETELLKRLREQAQRQPAPDVKIRGDEAASFQTVGRVLHWVQSAGLQRIGFLTDPHAATP